MAYKLTKRGYKKPPAGYDYIEPVMIQLEEEMKRAVAESHEGKRNCEGNWPIHQINWQRSRYVFDMHYKHKRITKEIYDWCCKMKLVDVALCSKWRKQGYEKLCSTYAINPKNFQFNGVDICRVPKGKLRDGTIVESRYNGCLGCCSGKGGESNIFGNKYGQRLASIQIAREELTRGTHKAAQEEGDDEGKEHLAEAAADVEGTGKRSLDEIREADLEAARSKRRKGARDEDAAWAQTQEEEHDAYVD